jgi:hypothetical protein
MSLLSQILNLIVIFFELKLIVFIDQKYNEISLLRAVLCDSIF